MVDIVWLSRHGHRMDMEDVEAVARSSHPLDPSLSPTGVLQAEALGRRLVGEGIQKIFSSPFLRCLETAHGVALSLGLPIQIENGLGEFLSPKWFPNMPELRTNDYIDSRMQVDRSYQSVGHSEFPEDFQEMNQRVASTINEIVQQHSGQILVIGHGASVASAIQALTDVAPQGCELCHLSKVERTEEGWSLEMDGDGSHLT